MTKPVAATHDQEQPQRPSRTNHQDKVVSIKKNSKKLTRPKTKKSTTLSMVESLMENSSANGDLQARISDRAYELHCHRGGHHGQDLEDWLIAEREVLSEESC